MLGVVSISLAGLGFIAELCGRREIEPLWMSEMERSLGSQAQWRPLTSQRPRASRAVTQFDLFGHRSISAHATTVSSA